MQLTQAEENKNNLISAIITLIIFGLLLLFLLLFNLVTSNPPFPENGGGGGQEMALGIMDAGNDNVEYGSVGKVTDVVTETKATEEIIDDPNAEVVNDKKNSPEVKDNKTTVITPKKVEVIKPKTAAEILAEKFKKNNGKNGGGIGNNDKPGENGDPNGDPFKNGNGGHGIGNDKGDGDKDGPGSNGPGRGGKIGISLGGRTVVTPPKLPTDTKEEGKVVVEITVDEKGNVIEANPNGRGTTTSSALLKAKAKQTAMATKFNVDGKFEEQKGTITIVFAFD